jgi:phosphoribosylanthranilate isomerase
MIQLKVCGMKYPENLTDLLVLEPDYIGFIFWKPSSRYVSEELPELNFKNTKKVGVFVDASLEVLLDKHKKYALDFLQLHGNEGPQITQKLKELGIQVIKSFNVDKNFNFNTLKDYKNWCTYFLFDSKSHLPGGSGTVFDWKFLEGYNLNTPYFLSGGIELEKAHELTEFLKSKSGQHCLAIDINSKFEDSPGLKNIDKIKLFYEKLKTL